jgi:ADP-ribose pyrophosphatase YjhB (NUDIX family)
MKIDNLIHELEALIPDPCRGLPEDVFLFISRITPLINVDLLIQDGEKGTLLTWRDDGYSAPGWHVPGGIIRFKEAAEVRIHAVARQELLAEVTFDPAPLAIHEIIHPIRRERGHFISLLYRCRLRTALDPNRRFQEENPRRDAWLWHDRFPARMIPVHEIYRPFFNTQV